MNSTLTMLNSIANQALTDSILIVDDEPVNLKLLSDMLLLKGYKVYQAVNGAQALKVLDNICPELIILDIVMPEMTGYELCKHLKDSESTKDIPVIFMSGLNDVFDKTLAFDIGGVDYITKPFRVPEVISRVQNQLTFRKKEKDLEVQHKLLKQKIATLEQQGNLYADLYTLTHDLHTMTGQMLVTLKEVLDRAGN